MTEETANPNLQTEPLKAEYGHLREQRSVTAAPAPVETQREQPSGVCRDGANPGSKKVVKVYVLN